MISRLERLDIFIKTRKNLKKFFDVEKSDKFSKSGWDILSFFVET